MSNDLEELTKLNKDYVDSVQNCDVKRFDEILAQDFYCTNPDKSLVDRAAFLKQTAIPVKIKKQIKKADKISAWMEATQIAGFSEAESTRFFGLPDPGLIQDLDIVLRAPVQTRNEFSRRHAALLAQMP